MGLLQKRNNQLLQSQRKLQKEIGGLGKYGEKAPVDFGLAITDEKKRNLEFIKMCREDVKNGAEYMKWLDEEYTEMMDPKVEISKKIQSEREKILESAKGIETLKIVRERSSGPTIVDTEKAVLSQSKDGSMKKSIMTGTFANVTIRKRKPDDEITGSGKLKRAKAVGEILEHYSEHSPQTKAELVSKIILHYLDSLLTSWHRHSHLEES